MIAIWLASVTPASAADVLLSAGLSAMPTAPEVVVPSWRLGLRFGHVTPWLSVVWASVRDAEGNNDVWGLMPRLGARFDFGDSAEPVLPFGNLGVSAVVGHAVVDDTESDDNPLDFQGGIPPISFALGGGLDARIHGALSVSVELGVDYIAARAEDANDINQVGGLMTYGAVHFNVWLGKGAQTPPPPPT